MQKTIKSATIADGATKSDVIDLMSQELAGIITDANLTGTSLTFEGSSTPDGTFVGINDASGSAITLTVAASKVIIPDATKVYGFPYIKLVAGSAQSGSATTIELITRNV